MLARHKARAVNFVLADCLPLPLLARLALRHPQGSFAEPF
jgi:hypothetical protein